VLEEKWDGLKGVVLQRFLGIGEAIIRFIRKRGFSKAISLYLRNPRRWARLRDRATSRLLFLIFVEVGMNL